MKKYLFVLLCMAMLTGCGSKAVMETVDDDIIQPVSAALNRGVITLPPEAAVTVVESPDAGTAYLCDGYTVMLQTLPGGDLNRTLREVTGFSADALQLMQTENGGIRRIRTVWTAAGEAGQQVGHLTLLDDGASHFVLTCMALEEDAPRLRQTWLELSDSFYLTDQPEDLGTGS